MKKLLFLLIIASIATSVSSQERTAYGRVLDQNKNPVSGALIELKNTGQQTYTDEMGRFHLSVPKGNRSLLVTNNDFYSKKITLMGHYWTGPVYITLSPINNTSGTSISKQPKNIRTYSLQEEFSRCYVKRGKKYTVNKKYKVLFVLTKNGDTVKFNKEYPGRILNTGVFGFPQTQLPYDAIDSLVFNQKSLETIWKNGIEYKFISQDNSGYLCYLPITLNIPLPDIDLIQVRMQDNKPAGAAIIVAGATAGVVGLVLVTNAIVNSFSDITW